MYKAVIIDDDLSAIENIHNIFDWKKLNVTQIITINDTYNLAQKILQAKPDIVMIDIEMGETSGLDVIEQCKKAGVNALFIIISGHYNFDYAKTAIKLDVVYFLPKPIRAFDVDEATEKLIERLNMRTNSSSEMIDDISVLLSSKEKFNNHFKNEQLRSFGKYRFILTEADERILEEITKLCLDNSLHSKFKIGKKKYLFVVKAEIFTNEIEGRLLGVSATRRISMGLSDIFTGQKDAYPYFKQAYLLSFGKFIYGKNNVYKNEKIDSAVSKQFSELWLDKLKKLEQGKIKEFEGFVRGVPDYFIRQKFDFKHVMFFYNSIAYQINMMTKRTENGEYISILSTEDVIAEYASLKNMCDEFILMVNELFGDGDAKENYDFDTFEKILEHINNNYSEQLSLEKLSLKFNVSISYICKRFKEKQGVTFSTYLKDVRLERAKKLLENSMLSVMDVSEAVGYSDYFYFNKVFKANTGYTPGKYRKHMEKR